MDILHLVDRLEELFNESRPIPLTSNVIVDEDRMLDLIDQMRIAIPDAVKKAEKLVSEKDKTLAQAHEEANRTLKNARDKSDVMVERDSIVESAQARADQIVEQARLDGEMIRQEADDYTLESLTSLEIELERLNNQVRNGILALQEQSKMSNGNQPSGEPVKEASGG